MSLLRVHIKAKKSGSQVFDKIGYHLQTCAQECVFPFGAFMSSLGSFSSSLKDTILIRL